MALTQLDSRQVKYSPPGTGGVANNVYNVIDSIEIRADEYDTFQHACDAITSGSTLRFPPGTHAVTGYLTITGKSDFRIVMDGVVVPTGTLNNISTGLFHLTNCSNFEIVPNIVNASYASTINCFRLDGCTDWAFRKGAGKVDVKYNMVDGSAVFYLGENTKRGYIGTKYVRGGYGVLQNDKAGVEDISIDVDDWVGQVVYGNTGPGDAIEFNGPNNAAKNIKVLGGRFSGYKCVRADRAIVCGFANTQGVYVSPACEFVDTVGMINVHVEDGSSYVDIDGPKMSSGHIGVNVACNTTKEMRGISIHHVKANMPVLDAGATYAAGAGIKVATNQAAAGGTIIGLNVSDNYISTTAVANNGIVVNDHDSGVICRNRVSGFPGVGITVATGNANSYGIKHSVIEGNVATGNATNYAISRGVSGSPAYDALTFSDVTVRNNLADNAAWTLDSYSGGPQAFPVYPVSRQTLAGNAVAATDNTATKMFTISVPNAFCVGQVTIRYNASNTETGNRAQESGSYIFSIGRQSNSAAKISASSKFGNSQLSRIGSATPTVSLSVSTVSGATNATNTFDIKFTYNLGNTSENNCEFIAEYFGNINTITLAP